jgi:uncharacterized protein (DUF1697 family)
VRYAAFLRGVSPMNLEMKVFKKHLETAGCTDIKTVLASGNAVFTSPARSADALEKKLEKLIGKMTIVRSIAQLRSLLAKNPYARLESNAKRVVTFLRAAPPSKLKLPIEIPGARIHSLHGVEAYISYTPGHGPVFMSLIEKTLGKEQTTRTWDTVRKVAALG